MKTNMAVFFLCICILASSGITFIVVNEQKNHELEEMRTQYEPPVQPLSLEERYSNAVLDAMLVTSEEIDSNLTAILPSNPNILWENDLVLVVTWTKYGESYPVGNTTTTWWGDTWVTVVPELKKRINEENVSPDNLTLRVEQLLGLANGSANQWFVELWVKPDDLFRPSPDPEITDTVANLTFPANVSDEYKDWFYGMIISQYFQDEKYPWTRLGYTYDWGNPTEEIGVSEFVIRKNAEVLVHSKYGTYDYVTSKNFL